ncbi:hypothetical protein PAMP_001401 [Pampus punctatissimus]
MADVPQTVKIGISMKMFPNNTAVYFKSDGARFGQTRTIKLLTGSKYKIEVVVKPGAVEATSMSVGGVTFPLEQQSKDPQSVIYTGQYDTEGVAHTKSGERQPVQISIQFTEAGMFETVWQVKYYNYNKRDHCQWGNSFNSIEYECKPNDTRTLMWLGGLPTPPPVAPPFRSHRLDFIIRPARWEMKPVTLWRCAHIKTPYAGQLDALLLQKYRVYRLSQELYLSLLGVTYEMLADVGLVGVRLVDADEIKRLGKRFKKLDLDNSGSLSVEEFMSLPELQQNPLVQRVIDIFDTDGNGEVDFKEFIEGVSQFSVKGDKEQKLRFAFRIYDMDKDGYISNGELFQVLKMMVGNNLKDTQLQQIVDKTIINADKDGDGRISFEEFCAVVGGLDIHKKMVVDV